MLGLKRLKGGAGDDVWLTQPPKLTDGRGAAAAAGLGMLKRPEGGAGEDI